MTDGMTLNPLILVKFALWIATIVVATVLLRRRKVTSKVRLWFLIGGVLIFGFVFGLLIPGGLNPNPVASLRTLLTGILVRGRLVIPVAAMLLSLFAAVSGTTALNMVLDRDVDAGMERTADRQPAAGQRSVSEAAVFGGILVALGLGLALWMSRPFGMVVGAGVVLHLLVYTRWLKRRSPWPTVHRFPSARRFIAVSNALRMLALVWAGWLPRICPLSLALLGLSDTVMLGYSFWSIGRPFVRLSDVLFKFASIHMHGSTIFITLGALV